LVAAGFKVTVGARRIDRLAAVAVEIGAHALPLDVTDPGSVESFADAVSDCAVLVNNAGGALGLDPIAEADDEKWRWMYEANVLGTMRVTRAFLPQLIASGDGHVVNIGSVAGLETYDGGAGYTAAKHALRAVTATLRLELLGQPVRVTDVSPGMVDTEFSKVRFDGDEGRADQVYAGMTPLTADDVAECVAFAVTRPSHVNIDQLIVAPRDQARVQRVYRRA